MERHHPERHSNLTRRRPCLAGRQLRFDACLGVSSWTICRTAIGCGNELMAGFACAPVVTHVGNRMLMVSVTRTRDGDSRRT